MSAKLFFLCLFLVYVKTVAEQGGESVECYGCRIGAEALKLFIKRLRLSPDQISFFGKYICAAFDNDVGVCREVIREQAKIIHHIIQANLEITASHVCQFIHNCKVQRDWTINIPEKNVVNEIQVVPATSIQFRILHITDIHYDEFYTPGSSSKCNKFLCCQPENALKDVYDDVAGRWGSWGKCDAPRDLVMETFRHINQNSEGFRYAYFTGDIVSHRIWNTSIRSNINLITGVYYEMKKAFPGVQIFPTLGNHETHPVNLFSNTIKGIFNGHSHLDELILYRSLDKPHIPINVAWNGGSMTPYHETLYLNPNYRIFDVNSISFELLDYEQWTFDILDANLEPHKLPQWYKLYSFKKAYEVAGLTPRDVNSLLYRMKYNITLQEMNYKFRVRGADNICDNECWKEVWCSMYASEAKENSKTCY